MAKKGILSQKGEPMYPVTHETAIIDDNNKCVTDKLASVSINIDERMDKVEENSLNKINDMKQDVTDEYNELNEIIDKNEMEILDAKDGEATINERIVRDINNIPVDEINNNINSLGEKMISVDKKLETLKTLSSNMIIEETAVNGNDIIIDNTSGGYIEGYEIVGNTIKNEANIIGGCMVGPNIDITDIMPSTKLPLDTNQDLDVLAEGETIINYAEKSENNTQGAYLMRAALPSDGNVNLVSTIINGDLCYTNKPEFVGELITKANLIVFNIAGLELNQPYSIFFEYSTEPLIPATPEFAIWYYNSYRNETSVNVKNSNNKYVIAFNKTVVDDYAYLRINNDIIPRDTKVYLKNIRFAKGDYTVDNFPSDTTNNYPLLSNGNYGRKNMILEGNTCWNRANMSAGDNNIYANINKEYELSMRETTIPAGTVSTKSMITGDVEGNTCVNLAQYPTNTDNMSLTSSLESSVSHNHVSDNTSNKGEYDIEIHGSTLENNMVGLGEDIQTLNGSITATEFKNNTFDVPNPENQITGGECSTLFKGETYYSVLGGDRFSVSYSYMESDPNRDIVQQYLPESGKFKLTFTDFFLNASWRYARVHMNSTHKQSAQIKPDTDYTIVIKCTAETECMFNTMDFRNGPSTFLTARDSLVELKAGVGTGIYKTKIRTKSKAYLYSSLINLNDCIFWFSVLPTDLAAGLNKSIIIESIRVYEGDLTNTSIPTDDVTTSRSFKSFGEGNVLRNYWLGYDSRTMNLSNAVEIIKFRDYVFNSPNGVSSSYRDLQLEPNKLYTFIYSTIKQGTPTVGETSSFNIHIDEVVDKTTLIRKTTTKNNVTYVEFIINHNNSDISDWDNTRFTFEASYITGHKISNIMLIKGNNYDGIDYGDYIDKNPAAFDGTMVRNVFENGDFANLDSSKTFTELNFISTKPVTTENYIITESGLRIRPLKTESETFIRPLTRETQIRVNRKYILKYKAEYPDDYPSSYKIVRVFSGDGSGDIKNPLSFYKSDMDGNGMLCKLVDTTSYVTQEDYNCISLDVYNGVYKENVWVLMKECSLIDVTDLPEYWHNPDVWKDIPYFKQKYVVNINSKEKSNIIGSVKDNIKLSDTGEEEYSVNYITTDLISVSGEKTYSIWNNNVTRTGEVFAYDSQKKFIRKMSDELLSSFVANIPYARYVRITFNKKDNPYDSVQLVEGNTAPSAYCIAKKNSELILIDQPLRKVCTGIDENDSAVKTYAQDEIIVKDGQFVVKRVVGSVLKYGSDSEKYNFLGRPNYISRYSFTVPNKKDGIFNVEGAGMRPIKNNYEYKILWDDSEDGYSSPVNTSQMLICSGSNEKNTINFQLNAVNESITDMMKILARFEIDFLYELDEPQYEIVYGSLNNKTYTNGTHMEVESHVIPTSLVMNKIYPIKTNSAKQSFSFRALNINTGTMGNIRSYVRDVHNASLRQFTGDTASTNSKILNVPSLVNAVDYITITSKGLRAAEGMLFSGENVPRPENYIYPEDGIIKTFEDRKVENLLDNSDIITLNYGEEIFYFKSTKMLERGAYYTIIVDILENTLTNNVPNNDGVAELMHVTTENESVDDSNSSNYRLILAGNTNRIIIPLRNTQINNIRKGQNILRLRTYKISNSGHIKFRVMLLKGAWDVNADIPYVENSKYVCEIESRNKNLYYPTYKTFYAGYNNKATNDVCGSLKGYHTCGMSYNSATNTVKITPPSNVSSASKYLYGPRYSLSYLKPHTTYTISVGTIGGTVNSGRLRIWDHVSNTSQCALNINDKVKQFVTPGIEALKNLYLLLYFKYEESDDVTVNDYAEFKDISIVEGTEALSPFVKGEYERKVYLLDQPLGKGDKIYNEGNSLIHERLLPEEESLAKNMTYDRKILSTEENGKLLMDKHLNQTNISIMSSNPPERIISNKFTLRNLPISAGTYTVSFSYTASSSGNINVILGGVSTSVSITTSGSANISVTIPVNPSNKNLVIEEGNNVYISSLIISPCNNLSGYINNVAGGYSNATENGKYVMAMASAHSAGFVYNKILLDSPIHKIPYSNGNIIDRIVYRKGRSILIKQTKLINKDNMIIEPIDYDNWTEDLAKYKIYTSEMGANEFFKGDSNNENVLLNNVFANGELVTVNGEESYISISIPRGTLFRKAGSNSGYRIVEASLFKEYLLSRNFEIVYATKEIHYDEIECVDGTVGNRLSLSIGSDETMLINNTNVPVKFITKGLYSKVDISPSSKYTLIFNTTIPDKVITIDLGGTLAYALTVNGVNKIDITTPETLSNNELAISGEGEITINNIMLISEHHHIENIYIEGIESVSEEHKLVSVIPKNVVIANNNSANAEVIRYFATDNGEIYSKLDPSNTNFYFLKDEIDVSTNTRKGISLKPNTSYTVIINGKFYTNTDTRFEVKFFNVKSTGETVTAVTSEIFSANNNYTQKNGAYAFTTGSYDVRDIGVSFSFYDGRTFDNITDMQLCVRIYEGNFTNSEINFTDIPFHVGTKYALDIAENDSNGTISHRSFLMNEPLRGTATVKDRILNIGGELIVERNLEQFEDEEGYRVGKLLSPKYEEPIVYPEIDSKHLKYINSSTNYLYVSSNVPPTFKQVEHYEFIRGLKPNTTYRVSARCHYDLCVKLGGAVSVIKGSSSVNVRNYVEITTASRDQGFDKYLYINTWDSLEVLDILVTEVDKHVNTYFKGHISLMENMGYKNMLAVGNNPQIYIRENSDVILPSSDYVAGKKDTCRILRIDLLEGQIIKPGVKYNVSFEIISTNITVIKKIGIAFRNVDATSNSTYYPGLSFRDSSFNTSNRISISIVPYTHNVEYPRLWIYFDFNSSGNHYMRIKNIILMEETDCFQVPNLIPYKNTSEDKKYLQVLQTTNKNILNTTNGWFGLAPYEVNANSIKVTHGIDNSSNTTFAYTILQLRQDTEYTLSWKKCTGYNGATPCLVLFGLSKSELQNFDYTFTALADLTTSGPGSVTFKTRKTGKIFNGNYCLLFYAQSVSNVSNTRDMYSVYEEVMLEEGNVATQYLAYNGKNTVISANKPMRRINNEIYDTLVRYNGRWAIRRVVEEITNEQLRDIATKTCFIRPVNNANKTMAFGIRYNSIDNINKISINNKAVNSDKLVDEEPFALWETDEELFTFNDYLTIRINKNELESHDINGFIKWLKDHPFTIWYETYPHYEYVDVTPEPGNRGIIKVPTGCSNRDQYMHVVNRCAVPTNNRVVTPGIECPGLLPNTQYNLSYSVAQSSLKLGGSDWVNSSNSSGVTIITPSIIKDNTLRIGRQSEILTTDFTKKRINPPVVAFGNSNFIGDINDIASVGEDNGLKLHSRKYKDCIFDEIDLQNSANRLIKTNKTYWYLPIQTGLKNANIYFNINCKKFNSESIISGALYWRTEIIANNTTTEGGGSRIIVKSIDEPVQRSFYIQSNSKGYIYLIFLAEDKNINSEGLLDLYRTTANLVSSLYIGLQPMTSAMNISPKTTVNDIKYIDENGKFQPTILRKIGDVADTIKASENDPNKYIYNKVIHELVIPQNTVRAEDINVTSNERDSFVSIYMTFKGPAAVAGSVTINNMPLIEKAYINQPNVIKFIVPKGDMYVPNVPSDMRVAFVDYMNRIGKDIRILYRLEQPQIYPCVPPHTPVYSDYKTLYEIEGGAVSATGFTMRMFKNLPATLSLMGQKISLLEERRKLYDKLLLEQAYVTTLNQYFNF